MIPGFLSDSVAQYRERFDDWLDQDARFGTAMTPPKVTREVVDRPFANALQPWGKDGIAFPAHRKTVGKTQGHYGRAMTVVPDKRQPPRFASIQCESCQRWHVPTSNAQRVCSEPECKRWLHAKVEDKRRVEQAAARAAGCTHPRWVGFSKNRKQCPVCGITRGVPVEKPSNEAA